MNRPQQKNKKHGGVGTRIYRIWVGIFRRCYEVGYPTYRYYGGRGIGVGPEWHEFVDFRAWAAANGYRDDLTLERNDNDLGYTPDNCRWIPRQEQPRNRRYCHRIKTPWGEMTLAEAARRAGVSWFAMRNRIRKGYGPDALFAPSRERAA